MNFEVYVKQEVVYRADTWARVKSFLVACGANHAFVVKGAEAWNISIRNGRMSKSTAT